MEIKEVHERIRMRFEEEYEMNLLILKLMEDGHIDDYGRGRIIELMSIHDKSFKKQHNDR